MKRSPLKRTNGLTRTPFKRRTTSLTRTSMPLRRTRLAPISAGRREVNAERARAQVAAWGPRPWRCALRDRVGTMLDVESRDGPFAITVPPCFGKVNGHEVLSRTRAGRADDNLTDTSGQIPLCDGHNGWLTQFYAVPGLVAHSWDSSRSSGESRLTW